MKNLNRRNFIKTGALATGAVAFHNCSLFEPKKKPPNLVYVFADQMRADALGYTGNKKAYTPNIDRFSSEAIDFTNAVSVMPVSAAYRASLFTGKYPSSHGMVINELNMNPNHRTIAHVLGDIGYNLGYVGKWHLNDQHKRPTPKGPERLGFDGYWASYSFNHRSYKSFYYTDNEQGELERIDLSGKYGPHEFTDLALDYMEEVSKKDEPFSLFLSWNPPHDPWDKSNTDPKHYERFKDAHFGLPDNFEENPDPYMDRYPGIAFDGKKEWKDAFIHGGLEECLRCYYAMNSSIDEQFGKILDKLDQLGIADNTIVVFTSDHGEMFGSQGRMYKLTFYDEASRIPFLIRYPERLETGKSDICMNTPDIMPTLLGLMGFHNHIPDEVEGNDWSNLIMDASRIEPEAAFMQGLGHTYCWLDGFEWRAVRDKRYTYAKYLRDHSELLFDREKDPGMTKNLSGLKEYEAVQKRLAGFMKEKMHGLNDGFKPCSWYREHWMYKDYSIKASARGEFGPLPPIEPNRK